jgi:hypothetical protein
MPCQCVPLKTTQCFQNKTKIFFLPTVLRGFLTKLMILNGMLILPLFLAPATSTAYYLSLAHKDLFHAKT